MDTVSCCYIQIFVVDRELDRKETKKQQQPTTQNLFLSLRFLISFLQLDVAVTLFKFCSGAL